MDPILNLSPLQLFASYLFIVVLLFIVKLRGIKREKDIIISSFRMTIQLVMTGYVLVYIFDNPNPFITVGIIAAMEVFAILNIFKRVKRPLSKELKKIIAFSMCTGTIISLSYFLFVVVQISPWYNPRYFIPIAGMIVGNSMTGVTLGVSKLVEGMNTKKPIIEAALMLGATPKASCKDIIDNTFDSAILPTINSMVGIGIVFLPGMMTGQILSGTSPLTAIGYQIAIMLGILGSVALTVISFLHLGYKSFYNDEAQLKEQP